MPVISVRVATAADLPLICDLIRQLAEYEGLLGEVSFAEDELGDLLFGKFPAAEVLIGDAEGKAEGFALYFPKLSTFKGRLVLHLEDLFVQERARGKGLGTRLLREVSLRAVERNCARVEWTVLDWNEPAIEFYKSLGANVDDDWRVVRWERNAIEALSCAQL